MSLGYAREKFGLALDDMATSPQSIQQRIADAYASHIIHVIADDLPEYLRPQLRDIKERLTHTEAIHNEGSLVATVSNMPTEEAVEIARMISHLNVDICSLEDSARG